MSPAASPAPPADPQPISAALKRHFDEELAQIESGHTVRVGAGVTTVGAQVGVGFRRGSWTAAGYAGREWGSGWLAGVNVAWSR